MLATLLPVIAGAVAIPGVFGPDARLLAIAAILASLGFVVDDLVRGGIAGLTPITLFALGSALTGAANLIGLLAADGENRILYFIYASPEHVDLAMQLALAGAVLPVIGYRMVDSHRLLGAVPAVIPRVYGEVRRNLLLRAGVAFTVLTLVLRVGNINPSLGTLTALYNLGPSLIAFVLVRSGVLRRDRPMVWTGVAIALFEAAHAFAFAYLRSAILTPLFGVIFGAIAGTRSIAVLRRPAFLPVYAVAAAFVFYFGALAEARQSSGALERIELIRSLEGEPEELTQPRQTLTSRLTSFNQLSRVGDLVESNGFYNGSTLEYLGYAFIPRFLWPEKPTIAKGAWFALEIGQAWVRSDGRISNSVNMTVQGELYLNFGWLGVFLGCLLFGALLGALWSRAGFWRGDDNVLGAMFGFYLVWVAFGGIGADLQIAVTLIAVYLTFVAGGMFLRSVAGTRPAQQRRLAVTT